MRVLFASTDGKGHLRPLLPFAQAVQDSGHDVAVLGSSASRLDGVPLLELAKPDDDAERGALMAGLPGLTGEEADRIVVGQLFGRLTTTAWLPQALEHVGSWKPDLVVHEAASAMARIAADAHDVPTVLVHHSLPSLTRFLELLSDGVAHLRSDLGLPPDDMRSGAHATFFPPSLELPDVVTPPVRRFRTDLAPSDRTGGTFVTFGSVAHIMPFFPEVMRGAVLGAATGPTLAATGGDIDLGPFPSTVTTRTWVDQHEVLRTASAVVCHGGSGTVLDCLAAGVPLVVVPLFADQTDNAARVAELGLGVRVDPGPDLEQRVASGLEQARSLERSLVEENAALPLATSAVPWFEELATRG